VQGDPAAKKNYVRAWEQARCQFGAHPGTRAASWISDLFNSEKGGG
jgi:hypothetical protein